MDGALLCLEDMPKDLELHFEPDKTAKLKTEIEVKLSSALKEVDSVKLVKEYAVNLQNTEETALDFICQEIHHPVITCFRELTKADFPQILGAPKFKRTENSLHYGIICLGLADYMANALDNPLYTENFKMLTKSIPMFLMKIISELKILFNRWRVSSNQTVLERRVLILTYLRKLAPQFKKIDDFDYEEIISTLQAGMIDGIFAMRQKSFAATSSSDNSTLSVASSVSSAMTDFEPERTILSELKINKSIFTEDSEFFNEFDQSANTPTKSRVVCNILPQPFTNTAINPTSKISLPKHPAIEARNQKKRPAPAKLTRVLVPPPEIIDIDCEIENPAAKKARIAATFIAGIEGDKITKVKLNAFTVLMNSSRAIARRAREGK